MFKAPNRCGAAACLIKGPLTQLCQRIEDKQMTYDRRTVLMKLRMGMNVVLVRLLAKEKRNVVAEDTGVANDSYSSV